MQVLESSLAMRTEGLKSGYFSPLLCVPSLHPLLSPSQSFRHWNPSCGTGMFVPSYSTESHVTDWNHINGLHVHLCQGDKS